MSRPGGKHDPPHGPGAPRARFVVAAVHEMFDLKPTRFAVQATVIPKRRTARGDGISQHGADLGMQTPHLVRRDP